MSAVVDRGLVALVVCAWFGSFYVTVGLAWWLARHAVRIAGRWRTAIDGKG